MSVLQESERQLTSLPFDLRRKAHLTINFADFQLDPEIQELRKNGIAVHVEPKVFCLITHLVTHAHTVFSIDELIKEVWPGRVVSDATVAGCVKSARKVLGDTGTEQSFIKTVRGRGFRFVATVTTEVFKPDSKLKMDERSSQSTALSPSLLVVPFRSLLASPKILSFASTLATRIGTVLTRVPLLRLHAQSFQQVGSIGDISARELHEMYAVDYVVDGSVEQQGQTMQISIQLTDASTGFSLWAEHFSVTVGDDFILNHCVTAVISEPSAIVVVSVHWAKKTDTDKWCHTFTIF